MLAKAKAAASAASDAASKVKESSAYQKASASTSNLFSSARAKAQAVPAEDRQRYTDVATTVLTLASVCGSKYAGGLAAGMAVAQVGSKLADKGDLDKKSAAEGAVQVAGIMGGRKTKAAAAVAGAFSRAVGGREEQVGAAVGGAGGPVVFRVVATVASGCVMPVRVEGVGDFQVVVPPNIRVGEEFDCEILLPEIPTAEPVPPPLQTPPATAGARGLSSVGSGIFGAAAAAAAASATAARLGGAGGGGGGGLPGPTGPAAGGGGRGMSDIEAGMRAMHMAKDMGVKPQDAIQAASKGAEVAKSLGITPQSALSMGMRAAKTAKDMGVTPQQVAQGAKFVGSMK